MGSSGHNKRAISIVKRIVALDIGCRSSHFMMEKRVEGVNGILHQGKSKAVMPP